MSSQGYKRLQYVTRREIFHSTTLLDASTGAVDSGFVNISGADTLHIYRSNTGGTYEMEADWSRDGTTALFTESIATTAAGRSIPVTVITPYVKVRVKNTHASGAFTEHTTSVFSDGS